MLQTTPSGIKYLVLPAAELRSAVSLPDILRAMPLRAPVALILPHVGKLDFRYFRECFDEVTRENGRVCLLANRAWVGFSDGRIVVNNRPAHSSRQWINERYYVTNGTEDMAVFNLNTDNEVPDLDLLEELANTALELELSAA